VLHAAAEHERLAEACSELPVDLDDSNALLPPTRPEDMSRVATSLASKRLISITDHEQRLDYWTGIGTVQETSNWQTDRFGLELTDAGEAEWRTTRDAWLSQRDLPTYNEAASVPE
jgi:hypothetical protein